MLKDVVGKKSIPGVRAIFVANFVTPPGVSILLINLLTSIWFISNAHIWS